MRVRSEDLCHPILSHAPFTRDSRLFELKHDGFRALTRTGFEGATNPWSQCQLGAQHLPKARLLTTGPGANRHGRDRIHRRSFEHALADRNVDQRIPFRVEHPNDFRVLENQRRALTEHALFLVQVLWQGDRAELMACDRKARGIFGSTDRAFPSPRLRLADVTGDAIDVRIVERHHTHLVVR